MDEEILTDALLTVFLQSQRDDNEQITIPLMIDVPVKWLHTIKLLSEQSNTDLGELTESFLQMVYLTGLKKCSMDLQAKYSQPIDVIKDLFKSMDKL